jgi:hypothetical protein
MADLFLVVAVRAAWKEKGCANPCLPNGPLEAMVRQIVPENVNVNGGAFYLVVCYYCMFDVLLDG